MENPVYKIATWLIPLIIAIVFHEVAHGWAARAFGDDTAARQGRLTLNPIKHTDPIGTIILPMMLALANAPIFGWAKPVPVVTERLRNPRWHMVLVALAGPGMNFLLGAIAVMAMALVLATLGRGNAGADFLLQNLGNFLAINVMLGVFNLIPLPPFDGGHVMEGVLPRPLASVYVRLRRYGMMLMIAIFVLLPLLAPNQNLVAKLIGPPVEAILTLAERFLNAF